MPHQKWITISLAAAMLMTLVFSVMSTGVQAGERDERSDDPRSVPVETLDAAIKTGRIPADVVKQAGKDGIAPVIIKLNLPSPFVPEGELDEAQVEQQRTAIKKRQQSILDTIAERGKFDDVKQYETVPWMAMQADSKTLLALVQHRDVFRIVADGLNDLHLGNSVPLIGGNLVQQSLGNAGAGQTVAIIDSGVDGTHPFLASKVVAEGCFSTSMPFTSSNLCPNGDSTDPGSAVPCAVTGANCGHGTHVAGIAVGNNTTQPGVAPLANLIAVQVFSDYGNAVRAYDSDVIQGLEHVYSLRNSFEIAAINMSLGGTNEYYTSQAQCDDDHEDHKNVIDNLKAAGIATVISSGNFAFNFQSGIAGPACVSSAVSVGATMGITPATEAIGVWPNTPPAPGGNASQTATFLDLLAPGTNIRSSIPTNNFGIQTGTSMAAPHVSGAIAVLNQLDQWQSVDAKVNTLKTTGVPITDTRPTTLPSPVGAITTPRIQLNAAVETYTLAPLAPSNVAINNVGGTWIQASWTDNSGVENTFRLIASPTNDVFAPDRSASVAANVTTATVGTQVANDGTVLKLQPDTDYNVSVEACDAAGTCAQSTSVPARTLDTTPADPSMLRVTDATASELTLHWDQDTTNPVTHFRLVKYACGLNYDCDSTTSAIQLNGSDRSHVVSGLVGNWEYRWRLQACNDDGCSSWVDGPSISTPAPGSSPAAPTNLHVCGYGTDPFELCSINDLTLIWDDNSGNEDFFEFQWTVAQPGVPPFSGNWSTAAVPNNRESYTMGYVVTDTIYYFQVRACNIYGCSAWSNMVIHSTAS